jgi:hypothetical protein
MTITESTCSVCFEALTITTEALCNNCGLPYHLNQRHDQEGKDCGQVWISEEHLSLEFACNTCLEPAPAANLDDILDLGEAAQAAGVSETWLSAEAERGRVRHRKTSGGTYLFERRDVVALTGGHG